MVSTEKVYDMLPAICECYEKLDIEGFRNKLTKEYKGKKTENKDLGLKLLMFVLKNTPLIKEEIFGVVSIFEDKEIEEIKEQSFGKTITSLKELFMDKEAIELFKSAVK